ncbi:AMSH-like ubiquitin thioesterase 2 isoform X2 [Typha angustifolia]|uniref:AMSH-like ubiquitin thioesterase 2 isoform X2 n=1 Tax=Typha angustifolia TaxID=59011 RepID=UPI003C2F6AA8
MQKDPTITVSFQEYILPWVFFLVKASVVYTSPINSTTNCSRSVRKESHRFEGNGSMDNASIDAKISRTPTQTFSQAVVAPAFHHNTNVCAVKHHFSSPIVSWIEDIPLVGHVSHVTDPELRNKHLEPSCSDSSTSNAVHDMHISGRLMEEFMELAKDNTSKNLETCGILGASFKNQTFYVTTLVVPKQESTAHSCQALNEEEIHAILDKQSLFPAGWIHTHPSQTCFLSSIDLHTQYSYQVMLPEAIAIVMAPTDTTRQVLLPMELWNIPGDRPRRDSSPERMQRKRIPFTQGHC